MHRPEVNKLKALAEQAKADARRRRSPLTILLTVIVLLSPFAFFAWWVWPGPRPRALVLAVYDQVARADQLVPVYAQLGVLQADSPAEDYSGHTIYVQDSQANQVLALSTGADGKAQSERSFPAREVPAEIVARFPGDQYRRGTQARGRVFIWPADTPLLIVDADHALPAAEEVDWQVANNLTLPALPDATGALRHLRTHYRIVYLTAQARQPGGYLKLRAWLERGWALPEQQFPDGPVLCPMGTAPSGEGRTFIYEASIQLKHRIGGRLVGVAGRSAEAKAFRDAGVQSYFLNETGEELPKVMAVPSWSALLKQLLGKDANKVPE
jgi:hypothetical protein